MFDCSSPTRLRSMGSTNMATSFCTTSASSLGYLFTKTSASRRRDSFSVRRRRSGPSFVQGSRRPSISWNSESLMFASAHRCSASFHFCLLCSAACFQAFSAMRAAGLSWLKSESLVGMKNLPCLEQRVLGVHLVEECGDSVEQLLQLFAEVLGRRTDLILRSAQRARSVHQVLDHGLLAHHGTRKYWSNVTHPSSAPGSGVTRMFTGFLARAVITSFTSERKIGRVTSCRKYRSSGGHVRGKLAVGGTGESTSCH